MRAITVVTILFSLAMALPAAFPSENPKANRTVPCQDLIDTLETGPCRLRLRLWTDKSRFKVGEPITITYTVETSTPESLYINRLMPFVDIAEVGVRLQVFDEEGAQLKHMEWEAFSTGPGEQADMVSLVRDEWILLRPGYVYGGRVELPAPYEPLTKPGRYVLKAKYFSWTLAMLNKRQCRQVRSLSLPVWYGEVTSEPIWIEIVE